jgi:uncharacterized RDD family membrane protein YckC
MIDIDYKDYVLKLDYESLCKMLDRIDSSKHPDEYNFVKSRIDEIKLEEEIKDEDNKIKEVFNKEISEQTDDDLFALIKSPRDLNEEKLNEIIETLNQRGHKKETQMIEEDLRKKYPLSSRFWKRIWAFLIDCSVLFFIGLILGSLFSELFIVIGDQGILIGFLLSTIYFGIGNSKITNGKTLGKRVCNLYVADSNLQNLTLKKSFLRTLLYTVPFFLMYYKVPGWSEFSISYSLKIVIVNSFFIANLFFFIFNPATRQTLNDKILNTFVINSNAFINQIIKKPKKLSVFLASSVSILVLVVSIILSGIVTQTKKNVDELNYIQLEFNQIPEIQRSTLSIQTKSVYQIGSNEKAKLLRYAHLNFSVIDKSFTDISPKDISDLKFVQEAARIFFDNYSAINQIDIINIQLSYGYSIGIYSDNNSIVLTNPINVLKKLI